MKKDYGALTKLCNGMNFQTCFLILGISFLLLTACENTDPNVNAGGEDILSSHETDITIKKGNIKYEDTLYVPIYSDIYVSVNNPKNQLAATLSIRNTSLYDSLYVTTIDYYDTAGDLVRSYVDNAILLVPLESVDYVIEKEDILGGSGANFILTLSATGDVRPVVQAVMIGFDGNKEFAFTTDAYSISRRDEQ